MGKAGMTENGGIQADKKKKMAVWKKILLIIAVIIVLIALSGVIFVNHLLNKINKADPYDESGETYTYTGEEFETDAQASDDTINPDEIKLIMEERGR